MEIIQGYPRLSKNIQGCPWKESKDNWGYPWMSMGIHAWMSMDIYEYQWMPADIHRFAMSPWISIDNNPWRNPCIINGCQGIIFVNTWHPMHVERISASKTNLDVFSARAFANAELSRFPLVILKNAYNDLFHFGRDCGPPRIALEAAWASSDHFEGVLSFE